MVEAIHKYRPKDLRIVLKPQLFTNIPPNKPLKHSVFEYLYGLCDTADFELAASVFDLQALGFALSFDLAHIKIACRPDLYWLAGHVPRQVPVHMSWDCRSVTGHYSYPDNVPYFRHVDLKLACVPEYPALIQDYKMAGDWTSFSDHTVGLEMFKYAEVIEKHIVLKRDDPKNPDSGPFAMLPSELAEI